MGDSDIFAAYDPRCPGCGQTHERKRVGESATFEVDVGSCKWRGTISADAFRRGRKRVKR